MTIPILKLIADIIRSGRLRRHQVNKLSLLDHELLWIWDMDIYCRDYMATYSHYKCNKFYNSNHLNIIRKINDEWRIKLYFLQILLKYNTHKRLGLKSVCCHCSSRIVPRFMKRLGLPKYYLFVERYLSRIDFFKHKNKCLYGYQLLAWICSFQMWYCTSTRGACLILYWSIGIP